MNQLNLYLAAKAHRNDPITSYEAAYHSDDFVARHRATILATLKQHGDMTCCEISQHCELSYEQIARRMHEGEGRLWKRTALKRPGKTQRMAYVWTLA